MKVYKTCKWNNKIEERDVTKVTEKSIYFIKANNYTGEEKEERELKVTSYTIWHNTKSDAINYLIKRIESKIEYLKREIENEKIELDKIKNLANNQ